MIIIIFLLNKKLYCPDTIADGFEILCSVHCPSVAQIFNQSIFQCDWLIGLIIGLPIFPHIPGFFYMQISFFKGQLDLTRETTARKVCVNSPTFSVDRVELVRLRGYAHLM